MPAMSGIPNALRTILVGFFTAAIALNAMIEQAYACACCETFGVVNVAPGDQLNVREGAGHNTRWVGAIQPGDCGIMRTGAQAYSNGALWYQITYGDMTGWVNSDYIAWIPSTGRPFPNQTQHQYPPPPNQMQHQYPPPPNQYQNPYSGGGAKPYWCNQGNHNNAEAAICDTPSLWSLDSALRTAYDRARSDSPVHAGGVRDSQRGWLQFRNQCGYDVNCLTGRYQQRIGWLETFFSN